VRVRQARLRPEYAAWFPSIAVAVWIPASTVARKVARQLREGQPRWETGPRILSDLHFTFRGGMPRGASLARTRSEDVPAVDPGTPPLESSSDATPA
jgi:hypothetical protein